MGNVAMTLCKPKNVSMLSASMLLLACSGASNNLAINDGAGGIRSCSDTSKCVKVEFTSEPLVNVNYSCETVNNVTGNNSLAYCPNDSELNFFIQAPTGKRKVALGATQVKALNSNDVSRYTLRRTPLSLVTVSEVTKVTDAAAKPAVNIIRFLDAFRTKQEKVNGKYVRVAYNAHAPVNQTEIRDEFKANMDEFLDSDVTLQDFASDAFINKTKKWLASHGLAVTMTEAQAQAHLKKIMQADFASVYLQPSLAVSPLLSSVNAGLNNFLLGMGVNGNDNGNRDVINISIYGMTLRDGGNIGQGLYWRAPISGGSSNAVQQYKVFYSQPFQKMRTINPQNTGFNVFSKKVDGFKWQIAASGADVINFNQGQFARNFVVLGNQSLKSRYIGDGTVAEDALGRWQQLTSGGTTEVAKGTATLTKIPQTAVTAFFDPAVWRSQHVVAAGEGYVFPLHAVLEFSYGNGKDKCGVAGCSFDKGKLGITILESGDIITDGSSTAAAGYPLGKPDCAAATLNNGVYTAAGYAEKRIGTIRATSQSIASTIGSFINPSIMLSGAAFGELDGVQIGTLAVLDNRVTIDVDSMVDAAKTLNGTRGTPNIYDIVQGKSSTTLKSAKWANLYTNFDTIRIQNDDKADTTEDKEVALKTSGEVKISLPACYSIKKRS